VSGHSTYETLRHLADSWGLLAMLVTFVAFVLWPFRPGARDRHDDAAQMIFKDDNDGEL
jgi:cytochrome c oxidase cbb3-type subunit 4